MTVKELRIAIDATLALQRSMNLGEDSEVAFVTSVAGDPNGTHVVFDVESMGAIPASEDQSLLCLLLTPVETRSIQLRGDAAYEFDGERVTRAGGATDA